MRGNDSYMARRGRARPGWARQGVAGRGKAGRGEARHGEARQGGAGRGKARHGEARQDKVEGHLRMALFQFDRRTRWDWLSSLARIGDPGIHAGDIRRNLSSLTFVLTMICYTT